MPSFTIKFIKFLARITDSKNKMPAQISKQVTQSALPPKKLSKLFDHDHAGTFENGVHRFSRKQTDTNKVVVYLHGGAYVFGIMGPFWWFCKDMLNKAVDHLYMVDYPPAYFAKAPEVIALATQAAKQAIAIHGAENVTIMGDSAGGGLALAVAQSLRNEGHSQPKQIITFSPWLDIGMTNPAMPEYEDDDVVLSIDGLRGAGNLYRGPLAADDPLVSPMFADYTGLAPITMYMTDEEIFVFDGRALKAATPSIDYHEYPGLFHGWVAAPSKESHKARAEVYAKL